MDPYDELEPVTLQRVTFIVLPTSFIIPFVSITLSHVAPTALNCKLTEFVPDATVADVAKVSPLVDNQGYCALLKPLHVFPEDQFGLVVCPILIIFAGMPEIIPLVLLFTASTLRLLIKLITERHNKIQIK